MRKYFVTIFILISISSRAQTLLPKIGYSSSRTSWDPWNRPTSIESKPGFLVGIGYEFPFLKEKFTMLFDVEFIKKGQRYSFVGSGSGITQTSTYDFSHNYIVLSPLVKKYFNLNPVMFYVGCGPFVGIGIGGSYKTSYSIYDGYRTLNSSFDGKIKYGTAPPTKGHDFYVDKQIDYGVQITGGVALFKRVTIDISYQAGLVSVASNLYEKINHFCCQSGIQYD